MRELNKLVEMIASGRIDRFVVAHATDGWQVCIASQPFPRGIDAIGGAKTLQDAVALAIRDMEEGVKLPTQQQPQQPCWIITFGLCSTMGGNYMIAWGVEEQVRLALNVAGLPWAGIYEYNTANVARHIINPNLARLARDYQAVNYSYGVIANQPLPRLT